MYRANFFKFLLSGISLEGLEKYAARPNRHVVFPPAPAQAPRTPAMLSAGQRARPPYHIPAHFPPLPDPHAYVRTPVSSERIMYNSFVRELFERSFSDSQTTGNRV